MFKIGRVSVGGSEPVIIAEAGVNHLGRMDYAERLVVGAAQAGAHIIKFQTYKAEKLSTKDAPRFWNWKGEKDAKGSQFDSYSKLDSFEYEQYVELKKICNVNNIEFMSTPFDYEAVNMLEKVGVSAYKMASCDITNLPFLKYVASTKKPMLLSTGAATIEEIEQAIGAIESVSDAPIVIMHCTLCYPTKDQDANLLALNDIKEKFPEYILGLSDHTLGTPIPISSVLLGVKVIEKHYTFDKTLPLSADHWLSVDPLELKEIVEGAKRISAAMGSDKKKLFDCEIPAHKYARRSLVSKVSLEIGDVLNEESVTFKRPGTGISPAKFDSVKGRFFNKKIDTDVVIQWDDLE
jgi:sialic acid synthase SpsE